MKKFLPFFFLAACGAPSAPSITEMTSGTSALLQAISIVDEHTVWMSAHQATFVRTTDGGESWEVYRHPTGDSLQFRDVHAFSASEIVLMSAGSGSLSQIFKVNNGTDWQETFVMDHPEGFLDCIDFWDDQRGIAYGDARDDYPYILLTNNSGLSWTRADTTAMPKAGKGEGGFAASGSCVTTGANGLAWIATGAGGNARILRTEDYGRNWMAFDSPMVKGEAAGHTAVDFVDEKFGFITGGDLAQMDQYTANCAFTTDGGMSWIITSPPVTKGAFYGGSTVKLGSVNYTIVCGPNGMDYTTDQGINWTQLDTSNYWAVDIHTSGTGWAVGKGGRVVRIRVD